MRRHVKKKITETILDLANKHLALKQAISQGNGEMAYALLTQCQEAAIWIGNTLEEDDSAHAPMVRKLEVYCEKIYEQSMHLGGSNFVPKLAEILSVLKEYIAGLPERLEVVFFPYKASMWDSLESVWMAAEQDADCDAYVIPIPYFDKNPDGTVSKMHYEGKEFPPYVPIVPWEMYDVEARHPDMIYIHNPYDHANKVTSVHLDYYAKTLRNYTDFLVYIPYFVCLNDCVPRELCVLPGTMYADRVIVQSEKTREVYIEEFRKFEEEHRCKGIFGDIEKKFLALGSPKYDKVATAAKEELVLPEEWDLKITGADGRRKKVLLYNTSVVQLLSSREKFLEKIESVFAELKKRPDIALLWRPHPLSETTYAAMQPELVEKYHAIVERYKKEDWGIYDDSPDLHRAIAVSDAYYGDMSSLVELYRVAGKPVMIQKVEK